MADPISAFLAPAITCKEIADLVLQIYDFIESAAVVDEAIQELRSEVIELQSVCGSIECQLKILAEQYKSSASVISDPQKEEDIRMGTNISRQLTACSKAVEKLSRAIPKEAGANVLKKGLRQLTLNLNHDKIVESRAQIKAHVANLQLSLLLVITREIMLVPQRVIHELRSGLDEIRALIGRQGTYAVLDNGLLQSAREVLSSGATIYTESVAAESVMGDSTHVDAYGAIPWLGQIHFLSLGGLSPGPSSQHFRIPFPFLGRQESHAETDANSIAGGEESDGGLEEEEDLINLDAINVALKWGSKAFEEARYDEAEADLRGALDCMVKLPIKLFKRFDAFDLRFKLSVCAFHVHDVAEAKIVLETCLGRAPASSKEALALCDLEDLLAQIYASEGEFQKALTSAKNSSHVRRKALGNSDPAYYRSLALLSKLLELVGDSQLGKTYRRMIPDGAQESAYKGFETLTANWSPATDQEAALSNAAPDSRQGSSQSPNEICQSTAMPTLHSSLWNFIELHGHKGRVIAVAFSADGKLVASGSEDRTAKIWSMESSKVLHTVHHRYPIISVAFSGNEKLASGSWNGGVKVWKVSSGELLCKFKVHISTFFYSRFCLAFSPSGKLLACGTGDGKVRVFDVSQGSLMHAFPAHSERVASVAFSADDKMLASASGDKTAKIWDLESGRLSRTLSAHSDAVISVAFSAHGKLASGSLDGTISIFDALTASTVRTILIHSFRPSTLLFSADGTWLASASASGTKVWELTTGNCFITLPGSQAGDAAAVALSVNGVIATGNTEHFSLRLWAEDTFIAEDASSGQSDGWGRDFK